MRRAFMLTIYFLPKIWIRISFNSVIVHFLLLIITLDLIRSLLSFNNICINFLSFWWVKKLFLLFKLCIINFQKLLMWHNFIMNRKKTFWGWISLNIFLRANTKLIFICFRIFWLFFSSWIFDIKAWLKSIYFSGGIFNVMFIYL